MYFKKNILLKLRREIKLEIIVSDRQNKDGIN